MVQVKLYERYFATVRIRQDHKFPVKQECLDMEGATVVVTAGWEIENDDGRYPGEWAMQLENGFLLTWIASGDLADIKTVDETLANEFRSVWNKWMVDNLDGDDALASVQKEIHRMMLSEVKE